MQSLSEAKAGTYTIKWMFGIPEVLESLRELQIKEGNDIRVIQKLKDGLVVRTESGSVAIGNEIADRIKV